MTIPAITTRDIVCTIYTHLFFSYRLEIAERNVGDLQTLKSEFEQQIGKLQNDNQTLQQTVTR